MNDLVIKNEENENKKTFDDYDLLKLRQFANDLTRHAIAEAPYAEGSLVISLNGKFGCGKTCFLEMWKNDLESQSHEVIYVNAWKNDFF